MVIRPCRCPQATPQTRAAHEVSGRTKRGRTDFRSSETANQGLRGRFSASHRVVSAVKLEVLVGEILEIGHRRAGICRGLHSPAPRALCLSPQPIASPLPVPSVCATVCAAVCAAGPRGCKVHQMESGGARTRAEARCTPTPVPPPPQRHHQTPLWRLCLFRLECEFWLWFDPVR
eukprot:8193604-Pyramimonas_sp.AAC.1